MDRLLFEKGAAESSAPPEIVAGKPRLRVPQRDQVELQCSALDELLEPDHRARLVWAAVSGLPLAGWLSEIRAVEGHVGRDATDPRLLVALWVYATLDAVSSARELARLCETQAAYRWLCGGVSVNYHLLADFRSRGGARWDELLTQLVAALLAEGLVTMQCVAQDGMRVRAGAGRSSFRRAPTLEQLQKDAQEHLDRLKKEAESAADRQDGDARRKAAKDRAARERKERVDEAVRQHKELADQREQRKKGEGVKTRCSTTDPDARNMKTPSGGFEPAYNVQFATDADTRVIVGVDVTNEGSDADELPPMLDTVEADYGKRPEVALVDSAFATKDSVTEAERGGTTVVSTIKHGERLEKNGKDPHSPQRGDTPEFIAFRARMADPKYKELYKTRPSVAEFPNAVCRNQNLRQFNVRGLLKAKAVALWHALAFNFRRLPHLLAGQT